MKAWIIACFLSSLAFTQEVHIVPQRRRAADSADSVKPKVPSIGGLAFRGVVPGMGYGAFLETLRTRLKEQWQQGLVRDREPNLDCSTPAPGLKRCTVIGQELNAEFIDSKLSELNWSIPHEQFSQVRDGLVSKFGKHKFTVVHLQNRMGARFEGEVREWSSGPTYLHLDEYGSTLDSSSLTLGDRELNSAFVKRLPENKPDI
jgi:allophanate hydrolase subunit 2